MAKLGKMRGKAATGHVPCEVRHPEGGVQETGMRLGREVQAERGESLTQADSKGIATDEIPLGQTIEGPRTSMFIRQ